MKIYTKTGDKGKTSLFDGTRVMKNNIRVETYGSVDELNSVIGVVLTEVHSSRFTVHGDRRDIKSELIQIQNNLLDIGAILANPNYEFGEKEKKYFANRVMEFEKLMDEMTDQLPELANFILPGGGKTGTLLHLARTVCRRVERNVIGLSREINVDKEIIMYFNRLSDVLFTMSRFVNWKEGVEEVKWKKCI